MAEPDDRRKRNDNRGGIVTAWMRQYVLVLEFLATLAILGYIGHVVDQRYGLGPWGLLSGLLLGTAAGLYRMVREANKLQ